MTSLAAAAPLPGGGGRIIRTLAFGSALVIGAILSGAIAGDLAATGHTIDVFGLAALLLPVLIWRRPQLAPAVLITAAVLVEQVGQAVQPVSVNEPGVGDVVVTAPIPITPQIPLFRGLGSLHLEPADLLLLMIMIVYLARTKPWTRSWPKSHVSRSMAALLGCVVIGVFIGMSHHGQLRVSLMETRPYVYLGATYLLTAVLVRSRSAVRAVLWAFVISTGLKALQGMYVFFEVRSWHPRPESVLGHEDAYTFGVFILLVAALRLFDVQGSLRKVATWLLPLVIAANLANDRRAAWLMLGGGLLTVAVIAYRCVPERRHKLKRAGIILLAVSAVYMPAYWNKTGGLAQPARAIHSAITPDPRDASSDLYRVQENANLQLNIKQGGVLGKGFGVPIDYALPIVDLSKTNPNIKYIPHNGVLYVPMRMGLLGSIALWALLGTGIVAGCRLARSANREFAVVGVLAAGSLVAYALEGATDQGFFFYRIAFVTGTLLGLAEAARRIQRMDPAPARAWLHGATPADEAAAAKPPPSPLHRYARRKFVRSAVPMSSARPATLDRPDYVPPSAVSPLGHIRAAIVSSHPPKAGAEDEVERLTDWLGPRRIGDLIVLEPRLSWRAPQSTGDRALSIAGAGRIRALRLAIPLRRIFRRHPPTVVYADGDRAALASVLACVGTGIPLIWRRHDSRRDGLIQKFVHRRCRSVITASEASPSSRAPERVLDPGLDVIIDAFRSCSS